MYVQQLGDYTSHTTRRSAFTRIPITNEKEVRELAWNALPKSSTIRIRYRDGFKSPYGDSYKSGASAFDLYVTNRGTTRVNKRQTRNLQRKLAETFIEI